MHNTQPYAIFSSGGRQYRATQGAKLVLEKIKPHAVGDVIQCHTVLLFGSGDQVRIGKPAIEGATVTLKVCSEFKEDKIVILKKRRRKNYRRKLGHRQEHILVEVQNIHCAA